MALAETITVRLDADVARFQAAMAAAIGQVKALGQAGNQFQGQWASSADILKAMQQDAGRLGGAFVDLGANTSNATRATHILRGAMSQLAFQATGIPGPIGKITQALLQFGGGTAVVIGVTAAIAALALVYQAFTTDSREAAKAQEELIKQLQGVGVHAQLTAARLQRATIEAALTQPLGLYQRTVARLAGGPEELARREEIARVGLRSDLATIDTRIAQLTQETAKWEKGIADDAERTRRQHEASVAALDKMVKNAKLFKEQIEIAVEKLQTSALGSKDRAAEEVRLGMVDRSGKGATTKSLIEASFQPSDFEKALRRLGESAGKQFALALITGIQSMQDLMKSVLLQFLSIGLDQLFGSFFHGISGGGGGGKSLGGVAKSSAIAPASFQLSVAGGLSAPTTPFAVMRDAEWQRLLRGSLLVAKTDGFR